MAGGRSHALKSISRLKDQTCCILGGSEKMCRLYYKGVLGGRAGGRGAEAETSNFLKIDLPCYIDRAVSARIAT
jgi:hypothetical protein